MKFLFFLIIMGGIGFGGYHFQEEIFGAVDSVGFGDFISGGSNEEFYRRDFELTDYEQQGETQNETLWLRDIQSEEKESFGYLESWKEVSLLRASKHLYRVYETDLEFSGSHPHIRDERGGSNFLDDPILFNNFFEIDVKEEFDFDEELVVEGEDVYFYDGRFYQYETFNTEEITYSVNVETEYEKHTATYRELNERDFNDTIYKSYGETSLDYEERDFDNFSLDQSGDNLINAYDIDHPDLEGIPFKEIDYYSEERYYLEPQPNVMFFQVVLGGYNNRSFAFQSEFVSGDLNSTENNFASSIVNIYVNVGDLVEASEDMTGITKMDPSTSTLAFASFGNSWEDLQSDMSYADFRQTDRIKVDSGGRELFATLLNEKDGEIRALSSSVGPSGTTILTDEGKTVRDVLKEKAQELDFDDISLPADKNYSGDADYVDFGGTTDILDIESLRSAYFDDKWGSWSSAGSTRHGGIDNAVASVLTANRFIGAWGTGVSTPGFQADSTDPDGYSRAESEFATRYLSEYHGDFSGDVFIHNTTKNVFMSKTIPANDSNNPLDYATDRVTVFELTGEYYEKGNEVEFEEEINLTAEEEAPFFSEKTVYGYPSNTHKPTKVYESVETETRTSQDDHEFTVLFTDSGDMKPFTLLGRNFTSPFTEDDHSFERINGYRNLDYISSHEGPTLSKIFEVDVESRVQDGEDDGYWKIVEANEDGTAKYGSIHTNSEAEERYILQESDKDRELIVDGTTHKVNMNGGIKFVVEIKEYTWSDYEYNDTRISNPNNIPNDVVVREGLENIVFNEGDKERTEYYVIELEDEE